MTSESCHVVHLKTQLTTMHTHSPFKQPLANDRTFISSEPLGAPTASTVETSDPTLPPATSSSSTTSPSAPAGNAAANPGQTAAELTARAQATFQNTKEYLQSKETKPDLAGNLAPDQSPLAPEQAPVSLNTRIHSKEGTTDTCLTRRPALSMSQTSSRALEVPSLLHPQLPSKLYPP